MSPYLAFFLGGIAGILVHKVASDYIAKKKRKVLMKNLIDAAEKLVDKLEESLKDDDKESDDEEDDGLINMQEVLKDLREKESPKDE